MDVTAETHFLVVNNDGHPRVENGQILLQAINGESYVYTPLNSHIENIFGITVTEISAEAEAKTNTVVNNAKCSGSKDVFCESDSETDSSDDVDSIHETNHRSFKQSRNSRSEGHVRRRRASEEKSSIKKQCAVMYKNDEPVGILQPYRDTYQFLPIHSDEHIPVEISPYADSQISMKRDISLNTEEDEDSPELGDETIKKGEDNSQFSDDRYPYIFAKFKIDSRIEKPYSSGTKQKTLHKRESVESLVDEKRSNSLKSTLSRIQSYDVGAEVELRNILSDMGLIEDEKQHVDKREAELNEDEDLEHGTNKIDLVKLDNTEERSKRDDAAEEKPAKRSDTATKHYEAIEIPKSKKINEEEYIDQYVNKNEDQPQEQDKKDVKRSEDAAAQMEREIKSKLQKIKEEVRSEIEKIKGSNNEEFEDNSEGDEEQQQEKEKSQRKKRHVISTLVEEETRDIDPVLNGDNNLIPHIRRIRKRSLTDEDMLHDEIEDTIKESKKSENDPKLDSTSKDAIDGKKMIRSTDSKDKSFYERNDSFKKSKRSENDVKFKSLISKNGINNNKGIHLSDSYDEKRDLIKESKKLENHAQQWVDSNLKDTIDNNNKIHLTGSTLKHVIDGKTGTNLIIDLNPEIESTQKPNSFIRRKRKIAVKEPILVINRGKNDDSKSNKDFKKIEAINIGTNTAENSKSMHLIMDRLTELENLELGVKNFENKSPTENLRYESASATNKYNEITEKPFLTRNLKEYDEESVNDDDKANLDETNEKSDLLDDNNDKSINRGERSCKCANGDKDCKCGIDEESTNDDHKANPEENSADNGKSSVDNEAGVNRNKDTGLNRDKKSCKCNNGDKDCKCGKAPLKLLKGTDGANFVYIDDVPRLADGAPSFKIITSETENSINMKLPPIPPDKKRAAGGNINYPKTMTNFVKNLRDGGYTLDIDPDVYRITEENSKSLASRKKRNSFADLVEIHGGGPVIDHLVAIRERSMLPRIRVKRSAKAKEQTGQQLTLTDMSDEDLFGALPQSFEGELARFKRVKRAN